MRRQLLQRLWSREIRRSVGRTSSLSPPLQRSQRFGRSWRQADNSPEVCIQCQKLDSVKGHPMPEVAALRRAKSRTSSLSLTAERSTGFSIKRKSYSMESETTLSTETQERTPSNTIPMTDEGYTATSTESSDGMAINDAVDMLNRMNGNFAPAADINDNRGPVLSDANSFLIEIEGDQINITTSSDESVQQRSDNENNNDNVSTRNGFDAISYAQSSEYDISNGNANESANQYRNDVRDLATPSTDSFANSSAAVSSSDQRAIDSFISQILVDSLNNIIVVEGSVSEPGESGNLSASVREAMPSESQRIYFPHYQSGDDSSEYSVKYSNASSDVELPANAMVSVISGSSYPIDGGEMIVRRSTAFPRTDSMEVHLSSASQQGGNSGTNNEDEEDSVSLVDSLDDPAAEERNRNDFAELPKPETFFVPIAERTDESSETRVNLAMPEELRRRLQRRQAEISQRKEEELKRRQLEIQKMIEKSEEQSSDPSNQPKNEDLNANEKAEKKKSGKTLREEIKMLESYTVDAQGNLLYKQKPAKAKPAKGAKAVLQAKKQISRKSIISKTAASSSSEPQSVVAVRSTAAKPAGRHKPKRSVQQMTLYHHPNADTITPDTESGPRRMYQKTEIREGAKRIDILEIVECANSADSSVSFKSSSRKSSSPSDKSSKIPIPVVRPRRSSRSRIFIGSSGGPSRQNYNQYSVGKNFERNVQQMASNSKVDQIIADLLIEALNSSADIGIEFIKAPSPYVVSSPGMPGSSKRITLTATRRTNGKKSAHTATKYQQVFDAIPEERSSLSVESTSADVVTSTTPNTSTVVTPAACSLVLSSGKAAVQSDEEKPEVWFGCFGQSHNESPVEAIPIDEGIFKMPRKPNVLVRA